MWSAFFLAKTVTNYNKVGRVYNFDRNIEIFWYFSTLYRIAGIRYFYQNISEPFDIFCDISIDYRISLTSLIVIDILHEFLRVTDVLVDLLLDGIFRSDEMFTNTLFNPSMHTNLSSFSNFITAHCHLKTFEIGDKTENINFFKSLMWFCLKWWQQTITSVNCLNISTKK